MMTHKTIEENIFISQGPVFVNNKYELAHHLLENPCVCACVCGCSVFGNGEGRFLGWNKQH